MSLSNDYFTIAQAAEYCGVERGTMSRWIRERQVARQEIGREVVIPKDQVEVLKNMKSLEDVIREAAMRAGVPVTSGVQVRMNTTLMASHGRNVLELYDPAGPRAWVIEVIAREL